MLITGRQARSVLAGAGVSDRRARLALTHGLAGAAVRAGSVHLYDSDRVAELGRRPVVPHAEVVERCSGRLLVSRRPLSVLDPAGLRQELSMVPGQMSPWTALWIQGSDQRPGGTPFLATVAGFVVLGATVVHARGRRLTLGEPGGWFAALDGAQVLTGHGRQWRLSVERGR